MARGNTVGAVVRIRLIAGTLDISENLIFNAFRHVTPEQIFQYIASGLTGPWAFRAGMVSVVLGVAIHYTIALAWTALYFIAAGRWRVLVRRPVVCGLVYGALVYVAMNFVVLPLTRVPHARVAMSVASRVSGVLALLFCIGVTVAVLTAKGQRTAGSG
ncbi:MAG TPA: hypothetical protein VFE06_14670 [Acidobacteriaceae bacterium]|jgi:uncharacterized membrane protein YagU involved in acid resistance|nr:hypothetical protein [Acidobacteriaceae bacterium]